MADYVFGYGSLLERASRTRTNPDSVGAWPAEVTGYERGWFHQFAKHVGSTCTFLGAVQNAPKTMNGVIYEVADLNSTIKREVGYTATYLQLDQIKMLDGFGPWKPGGDVKIVIFLSDPESVSSTKEPTPQFPIVQSYVDICINGCLEINALYRAVNGEFDQKFIETTTGWNANWVNDRIYPRRPLIYSPSANAIDKALKAGGVLKYVQLRALG